jgi:hypothetical protein
MFWLGCERDYYFIIFNACNNRTIINNAKKNALSVILNTFIYIPLRVIAMKRFSNIKRDIMNNAPLSLEMFLK